MTNVYLEVTKPSAPEPNKGGRPTKLTPELILKAETYLATCFDNPIFTDKGALAYTEVNLPSMEGFALHVGINRNTVREWCKAKELETDEEKAIRSEFSCIVDLVMHEQAKRLINNGAGGLYQAKVAGMILSRHGYAEKSETDITTGGDKLPNNSAVLPDLLKAADELLKQKKLSKPNDA